MYKRVAMIYKIGAMTEILPDNNVQIKSYTYKE